jgi:2-polyprenyl-3-methyl-5-hydroxy-6-metoxy-1,4-benzoquinol methylase
MGSWISTRTGQFAYFDRELGHPNWTGKRVLDFAGNVGNILLDPSCKIEPQNYWSIDVSRDAIIEGRRRHPDANFVFYDRYNFEYNPAGQVGLPIPGQGVAFDYIVGWSIFTHVSKAETLELADQLLDMLTEEGRAAFSFIDPWFTPPAGWAREGESPGLSNLEWRLENRAQIKTEMDVPAMVARCRETGMTWTTLVNDDDLYFDPDDDGLSADKPNLAYLTMTTPEYMQQLFPKGEILDPVPPERLHCLIIDKHSHRGL